MGAHPPALQKQVRARDRRGERARAAGRGALNEAHPECLEPAAHRQALQRDQAPAVGRELEGTLAVREGLRAVHARTRAVARPPQEPTSNPQQDILVLSRVFCYLVIDLTFAIFSSYELRSTSQRHY